MTMSNLSASGSTAPSIYASSQPPSPRLPRRDGAGSSQPKGEHVTLGWDERSRLAWFVIVAALLASCAASPSTTQAHVPLAGTIAPVATSITPSSTSARAVSAAATISAAPTTAPTLAPTAAPTAAPTVASTIAPTVAPTIAPTAAPTVAPTPPPTTAPPAPTNFVTLAVTSPASRNSMATASVMTTGGSNCAIIVTYNSGPSSAQGLGPKTASAAGAVSWTWMIGGNSAFGTYPVDVTCTSPAGARASARAPFTVH